MAEISILGCGWLGLPLAKELIKNGRVVKGSTTRESQLPLLKEAGIDAYRLIAGPDAFVNHKRFLQCDILILTLPPKRGESGYLEKIVSLFSDFKEAGIQHILFTSSISVYGNEKGLVTEDTGVHPDTPSASEIVAVENALRASFPLTTVLRLGGLTGPDRHPITSLAGRTGIPDGDAPINLVHLDDCIGVSKTVIDQNRWGETFNVVPPYHPSKRAYYTQKAAERNLLPPTFLPGGADGRIVDGSAITQATGYTYSVVETI
ncbi:MULTISPECIES: SDR family oxidoreductase [unclassified Flavobacterium]|uniref:SDR family oxidoreductase n=1 Tax=unclassified Flavobacterium TaxID=196869 RepID=UPI001F143974|nr:MULTISPECIES: SDR family oxidoreductase [unclassified Flavobacterium]UMY66173.1 SDR family oxidoreductase [Flavobacterium sp. HJ-32-4]